MRSILALRKRGFIITICSICAFLVVARLHQIPNSESYAQSDRPQKWTGLGRFRRSRFQSSIEQLVPLEAIRNSTLGFQKILVLGLPDRLDKKDIWSLANTASDLRIEWVDGVRGEDINPKAFPAGYEPLPATRRFSQMVNNTLGSWRGHMNAVRRIIDERLSSALILEDDVEWDVMVRQQLTQFAYGTRYIHGIADKLSTDSPYGDKWDLLLLGHCTAASRSQQDGRYWVIRDDPTVTPKTKYKWRTEDPRCGPNTSPRELKGDFNRIVYEPKFSRCAYAYALSLRGAQKLLFHFSVEPRKAIIDKVLSGFCTDSDIAAKCVSVFPNLFDEYYPAGPSIKDSDRKDYNIPKFRENIVWRDHGVANNIVFPVKAGLRTHINSGNKYDSQWPNDTLWSTIEPATDRLPIGEGFFLTRDKFTESKENEYCGIDGADTLAD